jgi:5'-deoxynucleotidase YfbR-like HD superfamily hydrolase
MLKELNIQDIYRASNIKRWQIVKNSFEQDIAQHSFNVAHIARELLIRIFKKSGPYTTNDDFLFDVWMRYVIEWALIHDLSEIFTGDVPTPLKEDIILNHDDWESSTVIKFKKLIPPKIKNRVITIVKIADLLCANKFILFNGLGYHSAYITQDIEKRLLKTKSLLNDLFPESAEIVDSLRKELIYGKENFL